MRGLVRTSTGVIHDQACHMARRGHATPWVWANRAAVEEIMAAVRRLPGHRQCRRCRPLDSISRAAWGAQR